MEAEDTYSLFQRGRAHMQAGDNAQATVSLEKAKRREPDKAATPGPDVAYLRPPLPGGGRRVRAHPRVRPCEPLRPLLLGRCLCGWASSKAAGLYKMAAWLRPEVTYYQEALASLQP
jgi:hypothetical protein